MNNIHISITIAHFPMETHCSKKDFSHFSIPCSHSHVKKHQSQQGNEKDHYQCCGIIRHRNKPLGKTETGGSLKIEKTG